MRDTNYIVYSYQYREMPRPKVDAFRRQYGDRRDLDFMPPTVIRWANIAATSKREALAIGKPIVLPKREERLSSVESADFRGLQSAAQSSDR